jgi:hypothetical protein
LVILEIFLINQSMNAALNGLPGAQLTGLDVKMSALSNAVRQGAQPSPSAPSFVSCPTINSDAR